MCTLQASFDKLSEWVHEVRENAKPSVQVTLLGNKCDLREDEDWEHYLKAKV